MTRIVILAAAVAALPLLPAYGQPRRYANAAVAASKTAGANLSSEQKANLTKLQSDLQAIKAGMNSSDVAKYKSAVKADLEAIVANGVTRPTSGSIAKFAEDLVTALTNSSTAANGKALTVSEKNQLATEINEILLSAGLTTEEVSGLIADVKSLLAATNISRSDVQLIVSDLQAIANEVRKNVESKASTAATGETRRRRL